MGSSSLRYSLALSIMSSPGGSGLYENLDLTLSPEDMYRFLTRKSASVTQPFIAARYSNDPLSAADEIINTADREHIGITAFWDSGYPPLLREISHPPVVLYHRGPLGFDPAIAVVGTRNASRESLKISARIAGELAALGFTIVSGMALGIDREAHLGALLKGGKTVGILANGIDVLYPVANRDVYEKIQAADGSVLVSEYPPGIHAGKWTFIRRNRIISGLCSATVIIEAGEKSGALITARYAAEQNREVFACPGHAFDSSFRGCHRLIRNGAHLLSETGDILLELPPVSVSHIKINRNTPVEGLQPGGIGPGNVIIGEYPEDSVPGKILKYLGNAEVDIDMVIRNTEIPTEKVHESLTLLELEGRVARRGNSVSRNRI